MRETSSRSHKPLLQGQPDRLKHILCFLEHRIIPEPQYTNAAATQERIASHVVHHIVQVLATVEFNREPLRVAIKIQDMGWTGMLTTELESTQTAIAQQKPSALLGIRGAITQVAGESEGFGR